MKKRLSALLLSLLVAALAILPTPAYAEGDRPLLDCITLYNTRVAPGGELLVGVDVYDSDGIDSGLLRFENHEGRRVEVKLTETLGYGGAVENWSGRVTLPADLPLGEYKLTLAWFFDKKDNRARYFPEASMKWESDDAFVLEWDYSLWVVTPQEAEALPKTQPKAANAAGSGDVTPPSLQWVKVLESRQRGNQMEYKIQVAATDVGDGIRHLALRWKSSATGRTISKVLFEGDGTKGVYTGWVAVNRYQPAATFTLENLGLYDRAGNYQAYCAPAEVTPENGKLALPSQPSFRLESSQQLEDTQPPVLEGLTLSHSRATVGTVIAITAQCRDDVSGVDSLSLQYKNREGKSISVSLREQNGQLFGAVKSFQARVAGQYTLTRAILTDKAGNRRSYYPSPTERGEPLPFASTFTLEVN